MNAAVSTPHASSDRVLDARTGMDAVTLRVGDLENMSTYYANALALEPIEERARGREVHRVLGRGTTPMVRLVGTPGLPAVDPRQAGLFHTAFLFDDAATLAAVGGTAGLRRRIGFWQGLVIAGFGTFAGAVAGILPPIGFWLQSQTSWQGQMNLADIPWALLLVLAVALPVTIALVNWVVPPREPELTRRSAIA